MKLQIHESVRAGATRGEFEKKCNICVLFVEVEDEKAGRKDEKLNPKRRVGLLDIVFLELVLQGPDTDAENGRRLPPVRRNSLQRLPDQLSLHVADRST